MSNNIKDMITQVYTEAYNKGKFEVLDDIIAVDYIRYQPPIATIKGLSAYKTYVADARNAYSDLEFKIEGVIAEGNISVARYTLHGRHTGSSPSIHAQPTGKWVTMPGCIVSQWGGGKIVVDWAYNDFLGLLQQFGVYPPPGMFA
jgi:predicted ester cyclase